MAVLDDQPTQEYPALALRTRISTFRLRIRKLRSSVRNPTPMMGVKALQVRALPKIHVERTQEIPLIAQKRPLSRVFPFMASKATRPQTLPPYIAANQLEDVLSEMRVLLRYKHKKEVGELLKRLHQRYPKDLLLLRRIGDFLIETGNPKAAIACLFHLAAKTFVQGNYDGLRFALERVVRIDPKHQSATRILALLDLRKRQVSETSLLRMPK